MKIEQFNSGAISPMTRSNKDKFLNSKKEKNFMKQKSLFNKKKIDHTNK